MHKPFDLEFDSYLPNLMYRTLGHYGSCLKQKVSSERRSYCVTYCPDIAKTERLELELALRLNGHRIFKTHDIPEVWKHRKICITVFVHQSLQYQLHLLPHIKLLRKLTSVVFRLFGTKLVRGLDPTQRSLAIIDARFWSFGTIILMTPKFIVNNEAALSVVLQYQKAKAGSTKLCIPPRTIERIEKFILCNKVEDKGPANKLLALLYTLKDRLESNDVVELPVDGPVTMVATPAAELEPGEIGKGGFVSGTGTEIDMLVDRFALFHLEECEKWRRFIVCHSIKENVEGTKDIFPTIDFLDPDMVMKELGSKGQPPTAAPPSVQSPATQTPQAVQTPPTARTPLSANR
ncbi:hypothetical protein K440DRAFT_633119 [Wilcoxina mikolae CBS 423.85]|nr:hypothetical protein K440DRAFT_633119 [Wilcoxina mikolae CBS 423.85]